jgi:IS1 family transposase
MFERLDKSCKVNYLCTDGLEIYKQYRFDTVDKDKYIPKEVYKSYKESKEDNKEDNKTDDKTNKKKIPYKKVKDEYSNMNRRDKYDEEAKEFSKHIANKKETCLIESINSIVRHYLARFNRATKRYSKSLEMMYYSLLLLFNKRYWKFEIFSSFKGVNM